MYCVKKLSTGDAAVRPSSYHSIALLGVLGIALTGCAAKAPVVDNSPLVRSATIVTAVENGGIKGQFASAGTRTTSTVVDRRREDDAFKFSGSIMSRIAKGGDASRIARLDRGLIYRLDNKRKTYQECPLEGCPTFLEGLTEGRTYEEDSEVDEETCQLALVENDVSLERTGNKRTISGYASEEYLMSWSLVLEDDAGEQMRSELRANTWTTPVVGDVAEAVAMADSFEAARRQALGQKYPENFLKSLPPEAREVIVTYLLSSMGIAQNNFLNKLGKLSTIQGFPVSHAVEWQATSGTCASPAEPQRDESNDLDTSSIGGFLSSIGKRVVDQEVDKKKAEKLREIGLEPVFSYVDTVESIALEELRSSRFDVPANYKLV